MALKAESLVGKEMGGADDTLDNLYDPETNPNRDMPLEELERLIDGEASAPPPKPRLVTKDEDADPDPGDTNTPEPGDEEGPDQADDDTETSTDVEVPGEPTETAKPTIEDRLKAFEEREEKRELELERLRLHNSRLAAKLGNTEKKLADRASRSDGADGYDNDGLAEIREEIATLKAERHAEALTKAVQEEFARLNARPDIEALMPQLQKLVPRFEARYQELASIQDVTEARLAARELQLDLLAEARAEKSNMDRAEAERRKLDASAKLKVDKKKASVTETSVRGAAGKPKAFDPETAPLDELEAIIDRQAGVQR
jgi:hypothetical protein